LTSALDEGSGQLYGPAALPPGKEPLIPTGQEAGWAPREHICVTRLKFECLIYVVSEGELHCEHFDKEHKKGSQNFRYFKLRLFKVTFLGGAGSGLFFFATASRPALRSAQAPIQWVLGASSPGGKVTGT